MINNVFYDRIFNCLFIPFVSIFMVCINVYNGNLINSIFQYHIFDMSIEYMLWFLLPLMYLLVKYDFKIISLECYVLFLCVLTNIYWYIYNPWNNDTERYLLGINNNDTIIVNRPRHRTEFYCSKVLLGSILFVLLLRRYDVIQSSVEG